MWIVKHICTVLALLGKRLNTLIIYHNLGKIDLTNFYSASIVTIMIVYSTFVQCRWSKTLRAAWRSLDACVGGGGTI